ncbi:MAG: tetratricopeptide repeat protein [Planctomycetes bacterium]|nr:tetratricopeptide repeat protein [Planctomycetota bacterium]
MESTGKPAGDIALRVSTHQWWRAVYFFCVGLLFQSAQFHVCADEGLDAYRLAVGFYNKDEWKLAADNFQAFLKNHSQHKKAENARFYYGLTLVKLDDFKTARTVLRNFMRDYPKSNDITAALYWAGHCSYFLDDYPDAEKELTRFVAAAPEDPLCEWALPYLADAELRLKKPEVAARHFRQALDAYPKGEMTDDAKFGLARCYEQLQKTPEALQAYRELAANTASPRAPEALLSLGDLYFDTQDYAAAATAFAEFETKFSTSPQMPQAQFNHGSALFQLKDYAQAVVAFDKAARAEKLAAEALFWKGLAQKSLPDLDQAVSTLQAAYEQHREHPFAEKLLFQWAQCEDRRGQRDHARELYVSLVNRWPKGALAQESLHAATVAAVDLGKISEADALLAKFDKDYASSPLRLRHDILRARLQMARTPKDYAGAVKILQGVIAATEKEGTRQQARYYLSVALQNLGQHSQVLEVSEPLSRQVASDHAMADYAGVFVIRAESQRALARTAAATAKPAESPPAEVMYLAAEAVASVKKYLELAPQGALVAQALAVGSMTEGLAARKEPALQFLDALQKTSPESPELERTLLELGRLAYAREDYELAEKLYGDLASRPKSSLHAEALADLGWSLHRQRKFIEAAFAFGRLLKEHPDDKLVPEAAFQRGISLHDAGQIEQAQTAFAEAAQLTGDSKEIFLAGWQSARLLGRLKKTTEADTAFANLRKRFPKAPDGDKILNEWATLHYDVENYTRGDDILRRLIVEYPNSPLAGHARLSLAESDLIAGKIDQARTQFLAIASANAPAGTAGATLPDAKQVEQARILQQRALHQLVQIELSAHRWNEVRKYAAESAQRFPDGNFRLENQLALAEADFQSGDLKAASERLQQLKSEKESPEARQAKAFPQIWVLQAEIAWRQKDYDAVTATVTEFREWDPKSPLLYQAQEVLGRSLKSQAKFPEARAELQRVLDDPFAKDTETAAKSLFLIADTYRLEMNYKAAYENFLKVDVLYKFPDLQAPALYQAGVCQEELQDWKKAARSYDDMLQRFPNSEHAPKARERLAIVRKRIATG